MIFEVNGHVMLFIEYLLPAHPGARGKPFWYNSTIPNWPHLMEEPR